MLESLFSKVREASIELPSLGDETINDILLAVADAAEAQTERILQANALDLERMDPSNPMYDRLKLTPERIAGIAADMRKVATLPSPLGRVLKHTVLPNGLDLQRVSVPFGVIGVVYEARPNVTFDVFSLCLKSGNACLLKGGKDADESNRCIVSIIKEVLEEKLSGEIGGGVVELLPATHEATAELLHARGWVDLVIPRGSKRLIDFVRQEATGPVIETGAGVCHAYFDEAGDVEKGARIINNAKTRRVSVCNALDCLLIHQRRLNDLPALLAPMAQSNVIIYADPLAYQVLTSSHLSPLGATGVFRGGTECGSDPTKGCKSPLATVDMEGAVIYPGTDATYTLYEDDGTTFAYEQGAYSTITFRWNDRRGTLTIDRRQGTYPGMPQERTFTVTLPDGTPRTIHYNGKKVVLSLR